MMGVLCYGSTVLPNRYLILGQLVLVEWITEHEILEDKEQKEKRSVE